MGVCQARGGIARQHYNHHRSFDPHTTISHNPTRHIYPHRLSQRSAATPARKVVVIEGTEFVIDPRYEVTRCVLFGGRRWG